MFVSMGLFAIHRALLLFFAAVAGGAINSVAGGGSFLGFPALLLTGIPPINANATNTMALWPGTVASASAYRRRLAGEDGKFLFPLIAAAVTGGLLGATILLQTPQKSFLHLIPYLLSAATLIFAASGRIGDFVRSYTGHSHKRTKKAVWIAAAVELVIATYIGFFGAGAGILMLAMLAMLGIESIHTMNAYKTILGSIGNGIAIVAFIVRGAIYWPQAILMLVGAILGGYFGAHYAQKVNPRYVRSIVIAIGAAMSIYFFRKLGF